MWDECPQLEAVLGIPDGLPPEQEALARAHAAACEVCGPALAEQEKLSDLLRGGDPATGLTREPDAARRAALLQRCAASLQPEPIVRTGSGRRRRALFFSFAAVSLAAVLLVFRPGSPVKTPATAVPAPQHRSRPPGEVLLPETGIRTPPTPTVKSVEAKGLASRVAGVPRHRPAGRRRAVRRRARPRPSFAASPRVFPRTSPRSPQVTQPEEEHRIIIAEGSSEPQPIVQQSITITAAGDPGAGGTVAVVVREAEETSP